MGFRGVDPWRWQYFAHQPVPASLIIPIDDASAWELYPRHRWIYNKLRICETQGLPTGPHGTEPPAYPIFSKPIYNLRGMGTGGRVIRSARGYEASLMPGHMWTPLFTGAHVSTDVALARGKPKWWRHTTGKAGPHGTFDYWTVHAARRPTLERRLGAWIRRSLAGFTGIINIETIGGRIIEVHLRMAEQWLDLNGPGWLAAVVDLYRNGTWRFTDRDRRIGYSVVLFGEHGRRWEIDPARVDALRGRPGVSSIQITFDAAKPPADHAMPPGGFRLAIVNCTSLKIGRAIREELRALFRSVPDDSVDIVGLAHRPLKRFDGEARLLGGGEDDRLAPGDKGRGIDDLGRSARRNDHRPVPIRMNKVP